MGIDWAVRAAQAANLLILAGWLGLNHRGPDTPSPLPIGRDRPRCVGGRRRAGAIYGGISVLHGESGEAMIG